jgi:hypothetical protein
MIGDLNVEMGKWGWLVKANGNFIWVECGHQGDWLIPYIHVQFLKN